MYRYLQDLDTALLFLCSSVDSGKRTRCPRSQSEHYITEASLEMKNLRSDKKRYGPWVIDGYQYAAHILMGLVISTHQGSLLKTS